MRFGQVGQHERHHVRWPHPFGPQQISGLVNAVQQLAKGPGMDSPVVRRVHEKVQGRGGRRRAGGPGNVVVGGVGQRLSGQRRLLDGFHVGEGTDSGNHAGRGLARVRRRRSTRRGPNTLMKRR